MALDLPFQEVGETVILDGDDCDCEKQQGNVDESRHWLLIQSSEHVHLPWNKNNSVSVSPTRIITLNILPGPGCEEANVGLCEYPATIEVTYRPTDDAKFQREYQPYGPGSKGWRFSWELWQRWLRRNDHDRYLSPDDERFVAKKTVRTRLNGWRWNSFCKTQYASNPNCGGLPNFLRCHVGVITLLDRIAALPAMKVEINDEGDYGPYRCSDDWLEELKAGRQPTYRWHKGKYDVKALAEELGNWSDLMAAFTGAMSDAVEKAGVECRAEISRFPNFEQLEFHGSQDQRVQPFLALLKNMIEQNNDSGAA